MSTARDILESATELVQALTALIESDTARALPAVARQLNVVDELNNGIDFLVTLLRMLATKIDALADDLVGLDALGGLLGMLVPLVGTLERIVGQTGQDLETYGLRGAVNVTGPISQGVRYARLALEIGSRLTDVSAGLRALGVEVGNLATAFLDLRASTQLTAGGRVVGLLV